MTRMEFSILPLVQPTPEESAIPRDQIRELCSAGLSECPPEDRCIAWLAILDLFPDYPEIWPTRRLEYVLSYQSFVKQFGMTDWHNNFFPDNVRREDFPVGNQKVMWSIYADISRTVRHICFLPPLPPPPGAPDSIDGRYAVHHRRLERILYVFALHNPSLKYMQGFNELVMPFYYANYSAIQYLRDDPDEMEALTFYGFSRLINDTGVYELFSAPERLEHQLDHFALNLEKHAHSIHKTLSTLKLHPLEYAFKWFSLLFAQEYQLPVLLIVWDALLARVNDLMDFVEYLGVAHLKAIADRLNVNDYSRTVTAIHEISIANVYPLLRDANEMYRQDKPQKKPPRTVSRRQSW